MAAFEFEVQLGYAEGQPATRSSLAVTLYNAAAVEAELGRAPQKGDSVSLGGVAASSTAAAGGIGNIARFTTLAAGRYWAKITVGGTTYWQHVVAF